MTLQNFQHVTPPLRLFHGADSLSQLGRELDRVKSQRAVVVCGDWLAAGPLFERVRVALGERFAGVFGEVQGHSPVSSVEDAAGLLRSLKADSVIAVGGGSAIVTARAASILAAEGKPVSELCTVTGADGGLRSPKLSSPKLPQFIVPTTPTTAMVKAGSAVFDPASGQRLAMFDPKTRVHSVFIDPEMILSAPRSLVATASINTLSMAIEGLTSRSEDALAQGALMQALRLIGQHLPRAARVDDAVTRGQLVLAAILCGQGTDHTAAGITTVLGHAIGARHNIENGTVNAIVLPHVLRFNAEFAATGMADVAAALNSPRTGAQADVEPIIDKVTSILDELGIPGRLRDVNVPREGLADIAAHAMGDWFLRGNPRPVQSAAELQQILEEAW
ncbi:iron-containing alcohol dehydrogenase family protein [Pseudoduganella umbonata]|uniref:Alcohol dehydrogenase class IV n=1 Tax=Pseudoduganella umbonata TaxID=864828 RepID=A0A4P8HLJ3_9BURK|nr:iron-containing alcohol dehydrogenase family protein [Pseudoduganella umbonata]MBB3221615.1 alcohol dehydrogenase class IV [Pseudoduganella umbonata]QCP09150.1 iron-containing alcohol dehydrogenase [Pseudoduganella umbonata]